MATDTIVGSIITQGLGQRKQNLTQSINVGNEFCISYGPSVGNCYSDFGHHNGPTPNKDSIELQFCI